MKNVFYSESGQALDQAVWGGCADIQNLAGLGQRKLLWLTLT